MSNAVDRTPDVASPSSEAEMAEYIADRRDASTPLQVIGGGTRLITSNSGGGAQRLSTRSLNGVVTYEPGALTLVVRTGTAIEEIEKLLAGEGQALAFEPMDHRSLMGTSGSPTIGGVVACNVSGPRRTLVGACRDHLLGVRFIDGRGRIVKNGGRVMKNVTGLDLSKLLCGSYGTLGVLTEVALKTLPVAETEQTLAFKNISLNEASRMFASALSTPFEVSGAAFVSGSAWLRIEGFSRQVAYRRERLLNMFRQSEIEVEDVTASRRLWRDLRDLRHFAGSDLPVWRILVKPTDAPMVASALEALGGSVSLDWGGGLIWYAGEASSADIRRASHPGQALLVRRGTASDFKVFPRESESVSRLSCALRKTFDPAGILNPGLMDS